MRRDTTATVDKVKIEIDESALGILLDVKEEIVADRMSSKTYSDAIRRLEEYRKGLRKSKKEIVI